MDTSRYRDLLWHFTVAEGRWRGKAEPEGKIWLRVLSSEEERYQTRQDPSAAYAVSLPLVWDTSSKGERAQWTRSQPRADTMRVLGRQLWEAIPAAAKSPLFEGTPARPCRLKISSDSPAIDDLPWEWLNDSEGTLLALRPEVRLARSVPIRVPAPPMSFAPPLRVLLVVTNPKDEQLLSPSLEIEAVRPRLSEPPYELSILEEPTWEALVKTLQKEPHIVHYIGHAGIERGEGNLILHDWQNVTHWISGSDLARVLPLSVRLLCLSTCFTVPNYQILGLPRLAQTSATSRLPTTVANRYPVRDASVREFWWAFYAALAEEGGDTNEAFHRAQTVVAMLDPDADWGSFSLVIRDQSGQGLRIDTSGAPPTSGEVPAAEIQAQLASRVANDLADALRVYGETAPESVQKRFMEEAGRASDLARSAGETGRVIDG